MHWIKWPEIKSKIKSISKLDAIEIRSNQLKKWPGSDPSWFIRAEISSSACMLCTQSAMPTGYNPTLQWSHCNILRGSLRQMKTPRGSDPADKSWKLIDKKYLWRCKLRPVMVTSKQMMFAAEKTRIKVIFHNLEHIGYKARYYSNPHRLYEKQSWEQRFC